MDADDTNAVLLAWRVVFEDLADLGRAAVSGARSGAADRPGDADVVGTAVGAGRGALGALGTTLADEGRAGVIGREVEAAVKVSLDRAGALLTAAAEKLRSVNEP